MEGGAGDGSTREFPRVGVVGIIHVAGVDWMEFNFDFDLGGRIKKGKEEEMVNVPKTGVRYQGLTKSIRQKGGMITVDVKRGDRR